MTTYTISGHWQLQGFMVRVSPALWANQPDQRPVEYRPQILSLSITKLADGGDWEASVSLGLTRSDIETLYNKGVGKFIEIFDVDGLLFSGCINKVNANLGTFSGTVGPLLGVNNKIKAVYSALDTSDPTNIVGTREETDWFQNTDSQVLYGIQERVYSVGGSTEDGIASIMNSMLSDVKFPQTDETVSVGQGGRLSISIDIVGLAKLFQKYTMVDANTGEQNASEKVKSVLNADPNSVYSTDQSKIIDNTKQVSRKEDENRTGWQVLKGVYSQGDLNYDRWIFGINSKREPYYNVVPSTIKYEHRLSERDQPIFDDGRKINPWRIKPGYWLKVSDFLVGKSSPINPSTPAELREDKRNIFIEQVTFRYPYSVSIKGGRTNRTSQVLAQAGLAGIG